MPIPETSIETLSGHDAVLVYVTGTRSWNVTVASYDLEGVDEATVTDLPSLRAAHVAAEHAGRTLTARIEEMTADLRGREVDLRRLSTDLALVSDDRIRGSLVCDVLGHPLQPMTQAHARDLIRHGLEEISIRIDDADAVLSAAAVAHKSRTRQRRCSAVIQTDGSVFQGSASTWPEALELALGHAEIERPDAFPLIEPGDVYLVPSRTISPSLEIDFDRLEIDDVSSEHPDVILGALGRMPRLNGPTP